MNETQLSDCTFAQLAATLAAGDLACMRWFAHCRLLKYMTWLFFSYFQSKRCEWRCRTSGSSLKYKNTMENGKSLRSASIDVLLFSSSSSFSSSSMSIPKSLLDYCDAWISLHRNGLTLRSTLTHSPSLHRQSCANFKDVTFLIFHVWNNLIKSVRCC